MIVKTNFHLDLSSRATRYLMVLAKEPVKLIYHLK